MPPTINPVALLFILFLMTAVVGAWIWAVLRIAFAAPVVPRFEPKVAPWGGKSVLAVFLAWLAVQVGIQYVFLVAMRGWPVRPKGERIPFNPAELMTASAVQNAVVLVIVPILLVITCRARLRDFVSPVRKAGWEVLQGMITWPLAAPIVYGTLLAAVTIWGRESHPLETAIQTEGAGGKAVIFFLAGAVLAPAAEELIFRGVLLGWLTRLSLKPRPTPLMTFDPVMDEPATPAAVAASEAALPASDHLEEPVDPYAPPLAALDYRDLSIEPPVKDGPMRTGTGLTMRLAAANVAVSILFASLHYTVWPTPVPIFFLSLALGFLYQRTGSLVAPISLHMTFNGVSTILMFMTMGTKPQVDPAEPPKPPIQAPIPKPVDPITKPPVASIDLDDYDRWRMGSKSLAK